MGIEDGQEFAEVLEANSRFALDDAATIEDVAAGWGDSDQFEPHAETASPWAAPDDHRWEPSDSANLAEDSPEPIEAAIAAESEPALEPIAPPAAHSLRSRIRMAEPDSTETFGDRLRAMFEALGRTLFRH